jgi:hypothetical protein
MLAPEEPEENGSGAGDAASVAFSVGVGDEHRAE